MDPIELRAGMKLQVTAPMLRILVQAVRENEGRVLIKAASASEDGTELTLELGREPRVVRDDAPDLLSS